MDSARSLDSADPSSCHVKDDPSLHGGSPHHPAINHEEEDEYQSPRTGHRPDTPDLLKFSEGGSPRTDKKDVPEDDSEPARAPSHHEAAEPVPQPKEEEAEVDAKSSTSSSSSSSSSSSEDDASSGEESDEAEDDHQTTEPTTVRSDSKPTEPAESGAVTAADPPAADEKPAGGEVASRPSQSADAPKRKGYSADRPPSDGNGTLTSYNRKYKLTAAKHRKPPNDVAVNRYVSTAKGPIWNSNFKPEDTSPKEQLPKIQTKKKGKFSYLTEGKSTAEKDKPKQRSNYSPYDEDDLDEPEAVLEVARIRQATNHVEKQSFQHEIHGAFKKADFARALQEQRKLDIDGNAFKACLELFHLVTHDKDVLSKEDLHELLLIFTPPGVAAREPEDFFYEECDHKVCLTYADFLQYGERLRQRLFDYQMFADLRDQQKLYVMHARIYPGKPPQDPDRARLRLLKASKQQQDDALPPTVRPLRVYEHVFLTDYQRRLYRSGLVPGHDIPADFDGDLPSDHPYVRRQLENEDVNWGSNNNNNNSREQNAGSNNANRRETEYPSLARCNEDDGGRGKRQMRNGRSTGNSARGGRRDNRPPFNLERARKQDDTKYMGRPIEDEYADRRTQDDALIKQLQGNYASESIA